MKKTLILAAALLATPVFAAGQDLKSIMQDMKLAFKQAAEAPTIEAMQAPISTLESLVEQAKRGVYPVEKEATYQEGFQKLAVTLDKIDAHLQAGELEAAKASLKTVDDLRIEYHDKRNPSIWKRLFG
ncbi:cytochrome b562 family protein [Vibrio cholerae]|uniref:cytochrome b562 n=1 Tax=Vibrio cholerae TaxID=666 RepID=UPI0002C163DF|nr:cytochrome b562 [Vibrio cholerae]EGR4196893.1 cytochrome b562 family protein [Vibrio cholerae]EIF5160339.1 cytochrome b562 family protein [Vibrio cholerae]EKI0756509.1 cytochrome b562 family protein [Vibrio cholerae]ELD6124021.1 cytochrome b562 family protein [Vibrio cholerae]EMQ59579.1 cytochrome b562 family protein [Vibrio cholerae O1 str. EM-1676A]